MKNYTAKPRLKISCLSDIKKTIAVSLFWLIFNLIISANIFANTLPIALTHIDTISVYCKKIVSEKMQVDFLNIGGPMLLMTSIWIPRSINGADSAMQYSEELINCAKSKIKDHKNIAIIKTPQDAKDAITSKKIGIIFSLEGGEPLENLDNISKLKSLGIKAISLTWSRDNLLASAHNTKNDKGLSKSGIEVIKLMNKLGIMIDVSHASDKTIDDILKISTSPIFASHSNSRTICNSDRNLTDSQIIQIARKGGIIGINFHSPHLSCNKSSSIEDIYKHIEHIKKIAGTGAVALGSDFDGHIISPVDLKDINDMNLLIKKLKSENWTDDQIESILYRNFLRFFEQVYRE